VNSLDVYIVGTSIGSCLISIVHFWFTKWRSIVP